MLRPFHIQRRSSELIRGEWQTCATVSCLGASHRAERSTDMKGAVSASMFLMAALSCSNFDRQDRIEDLRILAVKTEPAEILYSPLHLTPPSTRPPVLPLPTVEVAIEVFAYDPRGGRTVTAVQLCPAEAGDSTCRLYEREEDLLQEPAANRSELRALLAPQVFASDIAADAPAGRLEPFADGAVFRWTFSPAVIDFFIPDNDGNPVPSIFPLLPRIVVQAENLDVEAPAVVKERAFKRVPVALDLVSPDLPPEIAADLAAGLGISLCRAPIPISVWDEQGRADCLQARRPNQNPLLAGFHRDEDAGAVLRNVGTLTADDLSLDIAPDGNLFDAAAGDVLSLTPLFAGSEEAPNSVERYQVISFDINQSEIIILNRVEDLALNWYSTRGELSKTLSAEQFGDSLGVSWSLPREAQPGETDTLVVVILDQRGGTAVGDITVRY